MVDERLYNAITQFTAGLPAGVREEVTAIAEEVERQLESGRSPGPSNGRMRDDAQRDRVQVGLQHRDNWRELE